MDRRERYIGMALLGCMAVVLFWEIMAGRSVRPWEPFQLTGKDFEGFSPAVPGWKTVPVPVSSDPVEPNILAFRLTPSTRRETDEASMTAPRFSLLIRLAHGYNMPECMKIKGHRVEEQTRRQSAEVGGEKAKSSRPGEGLEQYWKVTDSIGNGSTWATSLIRADDFAPLVMDIRTIAFPRVGVPDEFGREEQGMDWNSMRHPLESLGAFFRAKWNAARCDTATFLKLKQPAWASGEVLTVVTSESGGDRAGASDQATADPDITRVHQEFCRQIRDWHRRKHGGVGVAGSTGRRQNHSD